MHGCKVRQGTIRLCYALHYVYYVCTIMYVWLCMYDCLCMIMYVWLCMYDCVCM